MSVFHYDPTEAQKVERIPEGQDFDSDDHFSASMIIAGVVGGLMIIGFVIAVIYALAMML
jgi:hypothetical protein